MPPLAYFEIESSGLSLAIDLLILFLVVLYGSLVYWTYADARRRIVDPMLIGCATAASLFPFVGTIVYMILRPPEYLEDVRERELELQAAELRLHELDYSLCPHCDYRIERDFIRCPSCLRKLKERCTSCSKPLDRAWTICPYCETEVPDAKPARRARRERASATEEAPQRARASASEVPARARASATEVPASERASAAEPPPRERASASAMEAPSRARGRAAVRAPEPATFVEEPSLLVSEPAPLTAEPDTGRENGEPELAPKSPASSRGASRRRSST